MKRWLRMGLLLAAQPALAGFSTTFNDPCTGDTNCSIYTSPGSPLYHGGSGANPNPAGDIIGGNSEDLFDILSMTVSLSGQDLMVNVLTRFTLDPTNLPNTGYGDLMLSTTGWHPFGATPYDQDTATSSGTHWNFVVLTDSGDIYKDATLANSDGLAQDGLYRHDQWVKYASGGQKKAETAAVMIDFAVLPNIFDGTFDTIGSLLTYDIPLSALDVLPGTSTDLALRWTMTGANDIIEASVAIDNAVPEPATLLLFLSGLLGWRMQSRLRAG